MKKAFTFLLAVFTLICITFPAWAEDAQAEPLPLELEKKVTIADTCDLELFYSEILSDQSVAEGWWYYYTDSLDSPAMSLEWQPHNGMHSTVIALFDVTNLKSEPAVMKDLISGRIEFGEEVFEGTVFQRNPDQTNENGYPIRSLQGVAVEPGETVGVDVLFEVSKEFHNTACAADTPLQATAYFTLTSGEIFSFDLNEFMVLSD